MAIKIPIISEFSPKGIKAAIAQFKALEGGAAKTAFIIKKAWLPVTAAIGSAATAAYKAADAAAEDQAAQVNLARVLKSTMKATDAMVASIEDQISVMQVATGFSDTQLRGAYARLATAGMDAATAQQALTTAIDVSRGTGKDLGGIVTGLAKAYNGNIGTLTRMGIKFSEATTKGKNFSSVLGDLNRAFSGQAGSYAETFSGRMDILRQRFSEIWETLGYKLLPVFERLAEMVGKFLDVMAEKGFFGAVQSSLKSLTHNADGTVSGFGRLVNGARHLANGVTRVVNVAREVTNALQITDIEAYGLFNTIDSKTIPAVEDLTLAASGLANNFLMVGQSIELTQKYLDNFMGPVASRNLDELLQYQMEFELGLNDLGSGFGGVAKTIDNAATAIETPTQRFLKALSEVRDSITQTFRGMFDLGANYDPEKGLKSFLQGAASTAAKIKQYGKDLIQLQAKGLGAAAIQGIMSMDLLSGASVARELLDSPLMKRDIRTLNTAYGTIGATSQMVGNQLAFGQMTGQSITQYITIPNADPNAVVRALRQYQNANGAIPIRVSGTA
jgi:hypothetical protein